jgi:hypothetical protein
MRHRNKKCLGRNGNVQSRVYSTYSNWIFVIVMLIVTLVLSGKRAILRCVRSNTLARSASIKARLTCSGSGFFLEGI